MLPSIVCANALNFVTHIQLLAKEMQPNRTETHFAAHVPGIDERDSGKTLLIVMTTTKIDEEQDNAKKKSCSVIPFNC